MSAASRQCALLLARVVVLGHWRPPLFVASAFSAFLSRSMTSLSARPWRRRPQWAPPVLQGRLVLHVALLQVPACCCPRRRGGRRCCHRGLYADGGAGDHVPDPLLRFAVDLAQANASGAVPQREAPGALLEDVGGVHGLRNVACVAIDSDALRRPGLVSTAPLISMCFTMTGLFCSSRLTRSLINFASFGPAAKIYADTE